MPGGADLMSLYGATGGRTKGGVMPVAEEGFALAVGYALLWASRRDSCNVGFFTAVSDVLRAQGVTRMIWSRTTMVDFVTECVFNGITQKGLSTFLQRAVKGLTREQRDRLMYDFVQSVVYSYLARHESGADYDNAIAFCVNSKIDAVLQCTRLGGCPDWSVSTLLSQDIWDQLGGQAGLKEVSKKFFTHIVAGAQMPCPVQELCDVCGEPRCKSVGKRLELVYVACRCESLTFEQKSAMAARKRPRDSNERGMNSLDTAGQGIKETYERKLQVVAVRYPNKTAKEIITKMIGADVARDSLNTSDEITGQQGGRLLASYLHSIKDDASNDFLSSGVNNFLQTQLDKYRMFYPSQKGLLEQALLFLPKLEQLAAAAAAAAAPPPDFGTPAPPPDFGTPAAARPRPGEAGPSAAPPPVEF